MARRRIPCLLSCLTFASVFFCTWSSFTNAPLLPSDSIHFRSLTEDTLQTARRSIHEAMRSLFEAYEDEIRTPLERRAMDRLSTKFERLQASLDRLNQEPTHNKVASSRGPSGKQHDIGHHAEDALQIDICGSLAGKRITMIGGEYIHHLHILFLQHREHTEGKPFPCKYHEFCTHHHICLPHQHVRDDIPSPRYVKLPTTRELVETESATVNYIVSDTLFSARNESSWEYTLPFVDPMTGIRLRETYWLAAARKANIVILGRGPLSAPGQTYAGNWSFLRHVPDYVDESRAAIAISAAYKNHDDALHAYQTVPRPLQIVNAAVHFTICRFLPDLVQLLRSIRHEVRPRGRKLLVWPSHWYRLPGRGAARTMLLRPPVRSRIQEMTRQMLLTHRRPQSPAEHVLALQLSALISADVANTTSLEDPWSLLFNVQVYLQNMVLRELLPRHGIVFLPLDVPWMEDARRDGDGYFDSAAMDIDPKRTATITETFLTGLDCLIKELE